MISKGEHQLVKKYTEKTFFIINAFSCALVFGIAGISSNFAIVYYGEEFAQSGTLMVCLNWTVFFVAWANVMRTQFLIPNKRDKIYVISTISGAVANLMINMALIGRYGAYGAAIGTFFAEFIVMFVQAIYIRKELPIFKYIFSSWRYFVAGIIMMIVVRGVGKVGGIGLKTLIIQVFVGALIYLICALTISYRKKDEIWNSIILQIYTKIKRGRKKKC